MPAFLPNQLLTSYVSDVSSFLCSFTREIPSRFTKEIVRAAKSKNDRIALDGMQQVLININMQHKVSEREMETSFREMGGTSYQIPADRMMKLLS